MSIVPRTAKFNIVSDNYIRTQKYDLCLCNLYGSREFGLAVILSLLRKFFINYSKWSWTNLPTEWHKLLVKAFLSATIFCKHFDMVSKLMTYENARVIFNFPSSLYKVVKSSKHQVQSILCKQTCKVLVNWVVKTAFHKNFSLANCIR